LVSIGSVLGQELVERLTYTKRKGNKWHTSTSMTMKLWKNASAGF
jgi:hypothetical protein